MKYIELKDSQTGLPVYVNAESVNAVYNDTDMRCTAVDVSSGVLFVKENARNVMNTLYQANFEKGFLFHAAEEKEED